MEYVYIAREIDNIARDAGYINAPDELIKEIFEYINTGEKNKLTNIFKITLEIKYNVMMIDWQNNNRRVFVKREKGKGCYYYCSCCDSCYPNFNESHLKTKKHQKNMKNNYMIPKRRVFEDLIIKHYNSKRLHYGHYMGNVRIRTKSKMEVMEIFI